MVDALEQAYMYELWEIKLFIIKIIILVFGRPFLDKLTVEIYI